MSPIPIRRASSFAKAAWRSKIVAARVLQGRGPAVTAAVTGTAVVLAAAPVGPVVAAAAAVDAVAEAVVARAAAVPFDHEASRLAVAARPETPPQK